MRWLLLLLIYLGCNSSLLAQNLTGKWVGYFTPNTDMEGRTFTYEMDIQEKPNHEIVATTITKFTNHSLAKAAANGLFTLQTKLVSIHENKFEQLQLDANSQACLMSNFLTYQNIRGHEILQGTYMSSNTSNGKDCGGGTVFLEKVEAVVKTIKTNSTTKPTLAAVQKNAVVKSNIKPAQIAVKPVPKNTISNKSIVSTPTIASIANTSPVANKPVIVSPNLPENKTTEIILPEDAGVENKEVEPSKKSNDFQVIPWVLVGRENKLVKKLITHNKSISIDLYDNGTIDNDTIIVYDNKQLIVNKKRLSYKAIHFDVNFSNTNNEHEIIIVAHNMGTVPPNTALLVYKDADLRQELFITSTNKLNAKLIVVYEPPKENP